MSYARVSADSDVYVFDAFNGGLTCQNCLLTNRSGDFIYGYDFKKMVAHLKAHRKAGHRVPKYTFQQLEAAANQQVTDAALKHLEATSEFRETPGQG